MLARKIAKQHLANLREAAAMDAISITANLFPTLRGAIDAQDGISSGISYQLKAMCDAGSQMGEVWKIALKNFNDSKNGIVKGQLLRVRKIDEMLPASSKDANIQRLLKKIESLLSSF